MDWHLVGLFPYIEEFPTFGCLDIWENMGFPARGYGNTVETLYKNIACRNKLVWKNIFPRRENFVSDLRIISFPRIFLGIN
jgi:hypothetical protein